MPASANDVVQLAYTNLSDSVAQGRFSVNAMLTWLTPIVNEMTRRLLFPEYRITFPSVANVQEYVMPEMIRTLRVYVAGQLIVPTDLPTLEGTQIQLYDQSGRSGMPAVQGGGPAGNAGTASPGWTVQMAETYPVTTEFGAPAPDAVPWFIGSRPRYYWRGGYLGLVPMPSSVYTITVDGVFAPTSVVSLGQNILIPSMFVRTAAWELAATALYSDRDGSGNSATADKYHSYYEGGIQELRGWRRRYTGPSPRGPKMLTQRSFYTSGVRRNYGGGWRGND